MSDDPIRLDLSNDAPAHAAEALRSARRDAPDAARLAAIEAAVLVKVAPPTGSGGGPTGNEGGPTGSGGGPTGNEGGSGGSAVSPIAKAGAAVIATGAVVVALVLATRDPQPPSVAQGMATGSVAGAAASAQPPPRAEPPRISVDDLPTAPSAVVPKRPSEPTTNASAARDPALNESAEIALLDRAQASLATHPADALQSCDEHARRFSNGALVQEREVLAIDALLKLGRRDEAEARAARFRHAFPRSGHLRRIDALLAR